MCKLVQQIALDKKAEDPVTLELKEFTSFTDYFVIVTGNSPRQNKTISEEIVKTFKEQKIYPIGVEGANEAKWILVDYGDVVIHIFDPETRITYNLENLWSDAKKVVFRKSKDKAIVKKVRKTKAKKNKVVP